MIPSAIKRGIVQFTSASVPGMYEILYTSGPDGSRCYAPITTNNDTVATHIVTLQRFYGGVGYDGNAVLSVGNAGFGTGSPPQSMLWSALPVDECGNPYIQLAAGDTLQVTFQTVIPAGKVINVACAAVDFAP